MKALYAGLLAVAFGLAFCLPAHAARGYGPGPGRASYRAAYGYRGYGYARGGYGGYRGYAYGYRGYRGYGYGYGYRYRVR